MHVIFKEHMEGKGSIGSIVRVARGYARNFLFPKGLALPVNPTNLAWLEEKKEEFALKNKDLLEKAQLLAQRLENCSIQLKAIVKDNGGLYGSLGSGDVSDALAVQGLTVDRHLITIVGGNIKALGTFTAVCCLYEGVAPNITIEVVADTERQ